MKRLLLCTDLDRTLVPNGTAPESAGARPLFARLAADAGVRLVYVTGRDTGRVDQAVAEWSLPLPDLVIADVGTTIVERREGRWERWGAWDAVLAKDWAGVTLAGLRRRLAGLAGLELQEDSRQGRFKLSYTTPPAREGDEAARAAEARLESAGVRANVIWSEDEQTGRGLLDVLPESATKRLAIEHLMGCWKYRLDETIFAGDSGNDLDVLVSPVPAVLVANAAPAVREKARGLARLEGTEDRLHFAEGGVLGLNGNYAAGILEGILHFYPRWSAVLDRAP